MDFPRYNSCNVYNNSRESEVQRQALTTQTQVQEQEFTHEAELPRIPQT